MNERQQRAWLALDLGPRWVARPNASGGAPSQPESGAPVPAEQTGTWTSIEVVQAQRVATASAQTTRGWEDLRAEVLACERCSLAAGRKQVVFGSGASPAPWMVIGEAPGEQEDLQGIPFVGPAGQLLDQMLGAIGVDRAREVFVTNVLKCRPPRNRDPQPEEVAQCRPWLLAQIAAVQPRIILAVGRFAAQTVLQTDEPIGRLRGKVHRSGDVPVVATYHPSYLLRAPAEKARAWQDLLMARSLLA